MSSVISCVPGCGPGRSKGLDREAQRRDKEISRMLKQWNRDEANKVQILMLGIGESGKSTITKQMKIIHINGFNDSERQEKIPDIRRNIKDSILTICGAMSLLEITLKNPDLQSSVDYLMAEYTSGSEIYSEEFYDHTAALWKDSGVQDCYKRNSEYQLIDSAKYFLDRIEIVRKGTYMPTEQDILRCRVMTNAIQRIDFNVKDGKSDVEFSVYDVGGQRGERRRWIQVFDLTTAILFVVDASSFDLKVREDTSKNRLLEALDTFQQVWNSRWLRSVSVILFINKIDLLAEKILNGHTLNELVDSLKPGDDYYDLFQKFKDFDKIKESDRREFIDAFPKPEGSTSMPPTGRRRNTGSFISTPSWLNEEVVKTAVFLKNIFRELVAIPRQDERGDNWHNEHNCEYYYTCAVDTDNIRKVLEGCRTLIIRQHLRKWIPNVAL